MGKGSQLSQLKAALQSSGLSRQSQPKRGQKRKRDSTSDSKDAQKRQDKLQKIVQDLNPFEVKVTKLKHDVGGRKLKGVTGRPGLSKQIGIETRKKTLLPELDTRNKAGAFVDRRFGENDPSMAPEDRMLERFTRERQRASKGALFNLEDETELTHYGQSLSAMDDFDDTGLKLSDDEEDDSKGRIDSEVVGRAHFGGFEEEEESEEDPDAPPKKKTKAEVMAEVIAKSKEHKYIRQLEKERDEALRQTLDEEFGEIRDILFSTSYAGSAEDRKKSASTGSNAIPIKKLTAVPLVRHEPAEDGEENEDTHSHAEPPSDDEYDKFVRELAFDKRSKPTNRLKTEEELAEEEKEKLEAAERARLRRMRGEDDGEGDEEIGRKGKARVAEADDLDDGLDLGEEDTGYGIGAGLPEGEAEESTEASEEDEEDEDGESNEETGEDMESDLEDDEQGDATDASEEPTQPPARRAEATNGSTSKELPFIFPCPASHEEFLDIIDGIDESQIPTVVHRIRVRYHPSLGVDYKEKLQAFLPVLIDHVLYAASPPTPSYTLVAALYPHIKALATSYPIIAAEAFIAKLTLMQKNLSRGLARGPTNVESKTWPGPAELALLRLIGMLWSTSDLEHAVVTPAFLLIGQYLAQSRVRSLSDVAAGLFLCTLCLQYTELSKRLVPEAVNMLNNALLYLLPHDMHVQSLPGPFPSPDLESEAVSALRLTSKQLKGVEPKRPDLLAAMGLDSSADIQTKVDLVGLTLALLLRTAGNLTSLDGFIELFEPTLAILEKLDQANYSEGLKKLHANAVDGLTRMLKVARQTRRPLRLQAHKPIPIATYIPKFDEGHRWSKRHDPDAERNAAAKLRAQYKQERRGAMRELRKDNRFLAAEKAKRQMEKDRAYNERMRKVEGSITEERHEEKMWEKEKAKQKRRAGRK